MSGNSTLVNPAHQFIDRGLPLAKAGPGLNKIGRRGLVQASDRSSDGQFSFNQAGKKFLEGVLSPITAIINNPLTAIAMVGTMVAVGFLVPPAVPFMVALGGIFALGEIGYAGYSFLTARNGDEMENSFKHFGSGVIGALLTFVGIRGSGAIAAEYKAMSGALGAGASEADAVAIGLQAAQRAKSMTLTQAINENFSMATTKSGLKALKDGYKLARVKKSVIKDATKVKLYSPSGNEGKAAASQTKVQLTELKPGEVVNLNEIDLLPGFTRRQSDISKMSMDDVVFVHMTDRKPYFGFISTRYEVTGLPRKTVHFSVNHPVSAHLSSWNDKKYCILIPGDEMIRLNGMPIGGHEADLYWAGNININSPRTVLLVQHPSPTFPTSKVKVLSPTEFGLSPDIDIRILGTLSDPHSYVSPLINKMGYTPIPGETQGWGADLKSGTKVEEFLQSFNLRNLGKSFLRRNGIREELHIESIAFQGEKQFVALNSLDDNSWLLCGMDTKEKLLYGLTKLEQLVKENPDLGKILPDNIARIKQIISESDTPLIACTRLKRELGIPIDDRSSLIPRYLTQEEKLDSIKLLNEDFCTQGDFYSNLHTMNRIGSRACACSIEDAYKLLSLTEQRLRNAKIPDAKRAEFIKGLNEARELLSKAEVIFNANSGKLKPPSSLRPALTSAGALNSSTPARLTQENIDRLIYK